MEEGTGHEGGGGGGHEGESEIKRRTHLGSSQH